jgi:hypothetical protein
MPPKASACKKPATAAKVVPAMPPRSSACKKPATADKVVPAMPPKASVIKKPAIAAKASACKKAKRDTKGEDDTEAEIDDQESEIDDKEGEIDDEEAESDESESTQVSMHLLRPLTNKKPESQGYNPDLYLTRERYHLDLDEIMERRRKKIQKHSREVERGRALMVQSAARAQRRRDGL